MPHCTEPVAADPIAFVYVLKYIQQRLLYAIATAVTLIRALLAHVYCWARHRGARININLPPLLNLPPLPQELNFSFSTMNVSPSTALSAVYRGALTEFIVRRCKGVLVRSEASQLSAAVSQVRLCDPSPCAHVVPCAWQLTSVTFMAACTTCAAGCPFDLHPESPAGHPPLCSHRAATRCSPRQR